MKNISSKLLIVVNFLTLLIGLGFLFGSDEEIVQSEESNNMFI